MKIPLTIVFSIFSFLSLAQPFQRNSATTNPVPYVPIAGTITNVEPLGLWNFGYADQRAGSNTLAKILFIGDSWTVGGYFTEYLRNGFAKKLPFAGVGFQTAAGWIASAYGITGTWITNRYYTNSFCLTSLSTTTAGSIFSITNYGSLVTPLYRATGGTFAIFTNGVLRATINATGTGTLSTNLVFAASTQNGITVSNISGTLDLMGFKFSESAGIRMDNIAMGGSGTTNWAMIDDTIFSTGISNLNPDLAIIMLGVNDCISGINPSISALNVSHLVTDIKTFVPGCGVVIVAQPDISFTNPFSMIDYAKAYRNVALSNGVAFLDLSPYFGTYAMASAAGVFLPDGIHLTPAGYYIVGSLLSRLLTGDDVSVPGPEFVRASGTAFGNGFQFREYGSPLDYWEVLPAFQTLYFDWKGSLAASLNSSGIFSINAWMNLGTGAVTPRLSRESTTGGLAIQTVNAGVPTTALTIPSYGPAVSVGGLLVTNTTAANQPSVMIDPTGGSITISSPTNGLAPPPWIQQPIGLFGSLEKGTTNTIAITNTSMYSVVTNWTDWHTNGFIASPVRGFLTNLVAGFYKITVYATTLGGAGDTIEGEIFLNETSREDISWFFTHDTPARVKTATAVGLHYLPANTGVSFRLRNNTDTDGIAVWRAGLTIGTP